MFLVSIFYIQSMGQLYAFIESLMAQWPQAAGSPTPHSYSLRLGECNAASVGVVGEKGRASR